MKLNVTFRWKIFIFYSLFVSLLILGLTISFYIYFSSVLTRNSFSSMEQSVERISQQLDSLIENMDNTSNIIFYNRDLQDILVDTLDYQSNTENYFDINLYQKKKVNDILFSILGTKNIPRRVCIFNGKHNFISLSTIPDTGLPSNTDLRDLPFLKYINKKNVYSITLPPHKDVWADKNDSSFVISFVRKISNTSGGNTTLLGYIEIQQPYSLIENICEPSISGNTRIFIRDAGGSVIYPINASAAGDADYYYSICSKLGPQNTYTVKNPKTHKDELIYAAISPVGKWTTLQVMPLRDLLSPVSRFQQIIILAGGLLIIITLIIMFFMTNSFTAPIRQLRKSLEDMSVQTPSLDIDIRGNNNEIVLFNIAFNKTIKRLHESMNQIVEARSREAEAHFLAFQAQMNPHFLYNSLMGISAAGQEYNNPKVVEMCTQLSRMLRYVASGDSSTVNMSEEIKYAVSYVNMLKFRYEDNLDFEFAFEEGMSNIKVPKLVLQPLVENSFSHGFANMKPPYRLSVKGFLFDNDKWIISVTDNGPGFKKETLEKINLQIAKYDKNLQDDNYENKFTIGGMAIFNIYVRLKMLYKDYVIFNISNNDSGVTVSIGGKIS